MQAAGCGGMAIDCLATNSIGNGRFGCGKGHYSRDSLSNRHDCEVFSMARKVRTMLKVWKGLQLRFDVGCSVL